MHGAATLCSPLGVIRGFAVEDADVAVVDVGIDGTDGGHAGKSFGQEFLPRVGGGFAFGLDLDSQEAGEDVGEAHASALVLRAGTYMILGDMLGILAVLLVVMERGLPNQTALDLPLQGAGWQTDPARQLSERKAPGCGESQVAVVGHGDLFAIVEC